MQRAEGGKETLFDQYAELGRKAGISRKTAKDHLISLMEDKILFPPQMRAKICRQVAEYIYLLKVSDVEAFISVLESEEYVFYYCSGIGSYNLIFMSYEPIDLSHLKGYEQTIVSGIRSNYYVPPRIESELSISISEHLRKM